MNINKDLYIENSDVTIEEIAEFIKNRRTEQLTYKPHDTYVLYSRVDGTRPQMCGMYTASNTNISFSIFLPREIDSSVTSIQINELKLNIRHADGGYIGSSGYQDAGVNFLSGYTCTAGQVGPNMVTIQIVASSSMGKTNNTPVSIDAKSIKLTFV